MWMCSSHLGRRLTSASSASGSWGWDIPMSWDGERAANLLRDAKPCNRLSGAAQRRSTRPAPRIGHLVHARTGDTRDETRAALERDVVPQPMQRDREAIAKPDQKIDVRDTPQDPC